jgi:hypothetical protein
MYEVLNRDGAALVSGGVTQTSPDFKPHAFERRADG